MRRGFHRALDFYLDYTPAAFSGAVVANGLWWGLWERQWPDDWRTVVADTISYGFFWPVTVPITFVSFGWSLLTGDSVKYEVRLDLEVTKNKKD